MKKIGPGFNGCYNSAAVLKAAGVASANPGRKVQIRKGAATKTVAPKRKMTKQLTYKSTEAEFIAAVRQKSPDDYELFLKGVHRTGRAAAIAAGLI
jgi:hypothetical protein